MRSPVKPRGLDEVPRSSTSFSRLLVHGSILVLAVAVLAASFFLDIGEDRQVVIPWLNVPVPATCTFKRLLRIDCPGCGLTRCFVCLARGDVAEAWSFNPAGLLVFGLVAGQIPFRLLQIQRIRCGRTEVRLHHWTGWTLVIVAAALLVQWFPRFLAAVDSQF